MQVIFLRLDESTLVPLRHAHAARRLRSPILFLILMGVSGSGKTTVGRELAKGLGWLFIEGDDFHPEANVEKMRLGIALTDDDRVPWLRALRERVSKLVSHRESAVITCSALKQAYRDFLSKGIHDIHWVYLKVDPNDIRVRLEGRLGHFMPASLLSSQFEILEEPADALEVDGSESVEDNVGRIIDALRRGGQDG